VGRERRGHSTATGIVSIDSRYVEINGRVISSSRPPFVIAELSGNHNGDIARALALMDAAAASGADAIKLQTYTPDTMTIDHNGPGFVIEGGPWNGRNLYDLYREAHTPWEWHEALFAKGEELGITVFSTPFDETAVDFLEALRAPAYKIASFELSHLPLLRKIASTGKPVIMSTGMASADEIAEAVDTLRTNGCEGLMLLHCISGYPTPPTEANLRTISNLAQTFNLPVGLSDHTLDNAVAIAAVAVGAVAIEKHFTLRRADGGPDAGFSLEPTELASLVADARTAWQALGEVSYALEPSEQANVMFRRSIYAVRDIGPGETITSDNVRIIRPGLGLAPRHIEQLIGRRARGAIARGTPMSFELLEQPGPNSKRDGGNAR
jgi:pseudaminic acid synthase